MEASTAGGMTSLVESAQIVGGYVWFEQRLFEILGGWVQQVVEPAVKLRLAADSHHHAWHASLWRERLPELAEMAPDEFVIPPGQSMAALIAALEAAPTTLEKLVGVYRVAVPRQIVAYARHRHQASPITDGPTSRALELVLADELADWRHGEALVQSQLRTVADIDVAAAHQARLETVLVGDGPPPTH